MTSKFKLFELNLFFFLLCINSECGVLRLNSRNMTLKFMKLTKLWILKRIQIFFFLCFLDSPLFLLPHILLLNVTLYFGVMDVGMRSFGAYSVCGERP